MSETARIAPFLVFPIIGNNIALKCNTQGVTKWSFNPSPHFSFATAISEKNTFIIKNITVKDSGIYICYGIEKGKRSPIVKGFRIRVSGK